MYVIILTKPFKAGHSGTACHLILDIRDFTRYHEKLVIYPPFPSLSRGYTLCIVSLFMAIKRPRRETRSLTAFYSCPLCVDSYSSAPVLSV